MPIGICFLGTSSARPTVQRSVSALTLFTGAEILLVDCGEGTERQMVRYDVPLPPLRIIALTHLHADHTLGLPGVLRALALEGRVDALEIVGPRGTIALVREVEQLIGEPLLFRVLARDLEPDTHVECGGYRITAFAVQHRGRAFGYVIRHSTDPDLRIVVSGDTRPCRAVVDAARNAALLVHEATFSDEEADGARETGHSTAREAAEVAREAGVRRLILTHFSARFSHDTRALLDEARAIFSPTIVARDGMVVALDPVDPQIEAEVPSDCDTDPRVRPLTS